MLPWWRLLQLRKLPSTFLAGMVFGLILALWLVLHTKG